MGAYLNASRNRTGTVITHRRILSPVRLPVPPPRRDSGKAENGVRTRDPRPWQGGALHSDYSRVFKECRLKDLNPRPSDYKSDALPTELSRR